ncbi:carbamoyl-phosphate synthase large subunit [Desulfovibrionales bacterium]
MPKRADLRTIMILGSGPIVIGQACEFDYSGTQACRALKEEGYRIVLLNSNPATVMTDPGFSDRTYLEPLNIHMASAIIRQERPDALLPTLGGQTALNLAMELHYSGILEECGVEMIGAKPASIELAENRQEFRSAMLAAGLDLPVSALASSVEEAVEVQRLVGFPAIIRPSYTLGGSGGGIAYNFEELKEITRQGLEASPIGQVLVEESVLGWKEMELEVVRDGADNAIVVCGIENLDPMGVHTGDSITVAPIQTLSDKEYQALRDDALRVVRTIGVDTGGCNIQFAINPKTGRRVVIEMNPRVSRSSALASKATGFPIARIATKLAVGYRLDELRNDITGTSACFEPTLDYCVVKVPRFNFDKFDGARPELGLQMHSVGETMALGGNFREALQKALRGLETGLAGLEPQHRAEEDTRSRHERLEILRQKLYSTEPERLLHVYEALLLGLGVDEIGASTGIDPWFLLQLEYLARLEDAVGQVFAPLVAEALYAGQQLEGMDSERREAFCGFFRHAKAQGLSDLRLANLLSPVLDAASSTVVTPKVGAKCANLTEQDVRRLRCAAGIYPVFRNVDTCAGEFMALTPYLYSTYDTADKSPMRDSTVAEPGSARKVLILGGGPNRIGQGVEFDYCCVQAASALRDMGILSILLNSNPETVSTDYDTADRLYFEPVTVEDVLAVCQKEKPDGVIVQFGGQTPLNLAVELEAEGVPIIGTRPAAIEMAENRDAFGELAERLGVPQPARATAVNEETACRIARHIGYPVMVRPSFVLGGKGMRIIHNESALREYVRVGVSGLNVSANTPVLVDKFLENAVEVDVDVVADGKDVTIAAIMEHIEQAGIHSGDSCCSIPTHTLRDEQLERIRELSRILGHELGVIGLLNIQFAVRGDEVMVIEANPRASRTVPFVSKAVGRNIAGIAARVMAGDTLAALDFMEEPTLAYHCVKESIIPFSRFPGSVIGLGPEMLSTGEVMGIDRSFGMAFLKSQSAAGSPIPFSGNVVLSVSDKDKEALAPLAARLVALGFSLYATEGTRTTLLTHGVASELVVKIGAHRPHLIDFIRNGDAAMIVNTVSGPVSARDATVIRAEALSRRTVLLTTIAALNATVEGLEIRQTEKRSIAPLQDYYAGVLVRDLAS